MSGGDYGWRLGSYWLTSARCPKKFFRKLVREPNEEARVASAALAVLD
jgi:hypothetical protein